MKQKEYNHWGWSIIRMFNNIFPELKRIHVNTINKKNQILIETTDSDTTNIQ